MKHIVFFCIWLIICSCHRREQNDATEKEFHWDCVPTTRNLTATKRYFEELTSPNRIMVHQEFIVVSDRGGNYPVHVIDKRTLNYMYPKGKFGFGAHEILDVWFIDARTVNNSFWVYSGSGKALTRFNMADTTRLAERQISQGAVGDFYMAVGLVWATDSTVISRMTDGKAKYVEFDLKGKRINEFGEWDNMRSGHLSDYILGNLYQGKLVGHKAHDVFALASIFVNRIELLDRRAGKIIGVTGPSDDLPDFKVGGKGANERLIMDAHAAFGYIDVYIGKKNVYALYSGRSIQEIQSEGVSANTIFLFDLKGNIETSYSLDCSLEGISVDEDGRKIYGIISGPNPGIAVFSL